jgi:hypothetical protein
VDENGDAMSRSRRRLLTWLAIVLVIGWIGWSMRSERKPTISFLEIREMNGMRCVILSVQNHSANWMDYSSALVAPCDGLLDAAPGSKPVLEGCRFDIVNTSLRGGTLQGGESALLSVPMDFGMEKAGSFQIVLPVRTGRPKWWETIAVHLDRLVPKGGLRKPTEMTIWSEVVTP